MVPIGVQSKLTTATRTFDYASPIRTNHEERLKEIAHIYGLTLAENEKKYRSGILLFQLPKSEIDSSLEQLEKLEGIIRYNIYRIKDPLRLSPQNEVASEHKWKWSRNWHKDSASQSLRFEIMSLLDNDSPTPALDAKSLFVTNPKKHQWVSLSPKSTISSGILLRQTANHFFYEVTFEGLPDTEEWMDKAEVWIPAMEDLGTFNRDFSIDLSTGKN